MPSAQTSRTPDAVVPVGARTEDAFTFYRSVFGMQFSGPIMRFGDVPAQPGQPPMSDADKNLVMHIELPILAGHVLMGTDAPETMGFTLTPFAPASAPPLTGDAVDEQRLFTNFWLEESKTTRKVLARIPEGSDYRPDPKSRTAKEIAWQIVCEEKMIIDALEQGKAEWAPPPLPATMKEVLSAYEAQSDGMERRWTDLPAERWSGDMEFFGNKRAAAPMAWSFLFDIVHHRGQITTYLRPMGSTVPQIYGPSGDEP